MALVDLNVGLDSRLFGLDLGQIKGLSLDLEVDFIPTSERCFSVCWMI